MSRISKEHHWKMIVNRKNKMEDVFQSTVSKRRFTPIKDPSMSNSRIFERSRQKQKSNSSIHNLNNSKELDLVSVTNRDKKSRLNDSRVLSTQHQNLAAQNSTVHFANKTADFIKVGETPSTMKFSKDNYNPVIQLQKQFKQFKQTVMKQLNKQQQYINQMVKEIIKTFEFELQKLKSGFESQSIKVHLETNKNESNFANQQKQIKNQIGNLERLKSDVDKKLQKKIPSQPSTNSAMKLRNVKSEKNFTLPTLSSKQLKFDKFFDLINKLKTDVGDMHSISEINSPMNSPRQKYRIEPEKGGPQKFFKH